jgi:hypothetical protein
MTTPGDFSTYLEGLLHGTYDCVDRISLRGYYPMGQTSGGLLTWWNQLHPGVPLTAEPLRKMAGDFGRRVNAYARKKGIPIHYCQLGDKTKPARAEKLRPNDPNFPGVFVILVAKAPALVWQAKNNCQGKLVLRRPKSWPLVHHYHFHILDKEWGHLTIKMSGHPPFGLQISLNGHEWVQRQAQKQAISWVKEGNCFVSGSDLAGGAGGTTGGLQFGTTGPAQAKPLQGGLPEQERGLRPAQTPRQVLGRANPQNATVSGAATGYTDVGSPADTARASDQTGSVWSLSAKAWPSTQEHSPTGCPLPTPPMRNARHLTNSQNRRLISKPYARYD